MTSFKNNGPNLKTELEETTYQLYEELFENREHSKDDLEL